MGGGEAGFEAGSVCDWRVLDGLAKPVVLAGPSEANLRTAYDVMAGAGA